MRILYVLAHLIPVVFYLIQVVIHARIRPAKQSSIDSWRFALVVAAGAAAQGVFRVMGMDYWGFGFALGLLLLLALGFITGIAVLVSTGMLISYRTNPESTRHPGFEAERQEMVFLSIGGAATLLVLVIDGLVLAGYVSEPQ